MSTIKIEIAEVMLLCMVFFDDFLVTYEITTKLCKKTRRRLSITKSTKFLL